MTSKDIQRYFDQRPKALELYTVGSIVFIKQSDADQYATEAGLVVETHLRNNQETGEGSQETGAGKPEKIDRIVAKATRKKAKK